jgi:hypothetical protein
MKAKIYVLLIALLSLSSCAQAIYRDVKGNGNVITRTITIDNYDEINVAGPMEFAYEQSEAAPFLSITLDENLLDYIKAEVKNGKLNIGPKYENEQSYNLRATTFKVKSNSRGLSKLKVAGSGTFNINSALSFDKLAINAAGSGKLNLRHALKGNSLELSKAGSGNIETTEGIEAEALKLNVAGSGAITAKGINAQTLQSNVSGSGRLQIEGKAEDAKYNLAGSGRITAGDCQASRVSANVSGSGRIEVYAGEALNAQVAGSGRITYSGNPSTLKENKSGSGSIRQATF